MCVTTGIRGEKGLRSAAAYQVNKAVLIQLIQFNSLPPFIVYFSHIKVAWRVKLVIQDDKQ